MKVHYFERYATNNSYFYREHPGVDRHGYADIDDAKRLFEALSHIAAICQGGDADRSYIRWIAKRSMKAVGGPPIIVEQPDVEDDDE